MMCWASPLFLPTLAFLCLLSELEPEEHRLLLGSDEGTQSPWRKEGAVVTRPWSQSPRGGQRPH